MSTLQLIIGNKNYSSWSMRPWVLMTQKGIPFDEQMIRFDGFGAGSQFKQAIGVLNPFGKVPVLVDGDLVVTDTLAIAEYLAERFPEHELWPRDAKLRAWARSACAHMHSGFGVLRQLLPMNIEADLREVGARLLREHPELQSEIAQVESLWTMALNQHGGPMLFGEYSIVDAFFTPVVMRFKTYGVALGSVATAYMDRIAELPSTQAWCHAALREQDFLAFEEPYRDAR